MNTPSHAIGRAPARPRAPRSSTRPAARPVEWLRALTPLWGMLLAAGLIVSRRPDAVAYARFWAEDGKLFYADVYQHGLFATLTVPQSGYFQELPVLAAGLAQLVPLAVAPLAMNLVAIAVRVLPVGLLLSRRAQTIAPDVRVRGLLAALYLALPGAPEANANADNALWFMAVAAVIVLMLRPPRRTSARVLDTAILALCAVTGVFSIALAPLALLYRRWRGTAAVSKLTLAILAAGGALQVVSIFVLEYHLPGGFGAAPRLTAPLHATVTGFFRVFGARVIAEPLLGNSVALSAAAATILGAMGVVGALGAFRRGTPELRLMIAFGAALFTMALARPIGVGWPQLLVFPEGSRYFIIPQLAAAAALVWAIGHVRRAPWRVLLVGVLAYMCLVTIPREWAYTPFRQTDYTRQAALFEHARPGRHMRFELEPRGWSMVLVKR